MVAKVICLVALKDVGVAALALHVQYFVDVKQLPAGTKSAIAMLRVTVMMKMTRYIYW